MSPANHVLRCRFCGAPLDPPPERVYRVDCPYCAVENRLLGAEVEAAAQRAESVRIAVAEGAELERLAAARRDGLQEQLTAALARGDATAAVRHFEGFVRMAYASTVHLYQRGMPPEIGEPALRQIDDLIRQAVATFAREQGFKA